MDNKKKLLEAVRELLEEESEEGEEDKVDFIRRMYIPNVPISFYDPGYERLRKLVWPGR